MLLRRFLKMRAQLFKRSLVFLFVLYFIEVGDIVKKSFQKWSGRGEVVIAIWGGVVYRGGNWTMGSGHLVQTGKRSR